MKEEVKLLLSRFPALRDANIEEIAANIPVASFAEGTVLQQEGEIPKHCFFVLKGVVRQFKIDDGDEKTIELYSESNAVISSAHYINQTPFDSNLICVEACLLICGNREQDAKNFEKFPVLKSITSQMVEEELHATKEQFMQYVHASPKQRYLNLLETRPDLINRVPLHQIASYLGITPESLSRIRKRIVS